MSAITILVMALLAYVSSAPSDIYTDVDGHGHCEEDEWTYHPGAENAGARAFVSHEMIDGVLDHVASHVVDQLEDGFCTGDGFEGEFPLFRGGEVEFELSDVCLKSSTMETRPSVYNDEDHSISKTVAMPLTLDFDIEYKVEKKYCHRRHYKKGECHRSGHVTLTVSDVELCSTFTPVRARNGIPTIRVDDFRILGGKDIAVHITLDGEELDELSKHLLEPLGSHILQVVLPLVSDMAEVMLAKFIDHRASHHRPCGIVQPGVIYDLRVVGSHPTEFIHVNEFGVEADLSFQAAPQLLGAPFCSPWNFDPSAGPSHPLPEFKFGEGENKIIPQYQLYISYWSMETALKSLATVGSMSLDLVKEPEIDKKYISAEYWDKVLAEIIIPPPVPLPPIEEEEHEEKQHEEEAEEHEVLPEPEPLPEPPVAMAFKNGGVKTLADMLEGGEFCEVHVVAGEEIWLHMNDLVTIMLSEEEEQHQEEGEHEEHEESEEHVESEEHEEGEEHGEKWLTLTVPYSVELRRCDVESSVALVTMSFDVKVDPELRHFTKEKWGVYRLSLAISEELKMTSAAAVTPVMRRSEMTYEGLELLKPFVHDVILPKMRESLESGLYDVHHEFQCKEEPNGEVAESCPVEPGLMVENWPEEEVISVYCHQCYGQ